MLVEFLLGWPAGPSACKYMLARCPSHPITTGAAINRIYSYSWPAKEAPAQEAAPAPAAALAAETGV